MAKRTINTLIGSSPVWTSELLVQGHQAVNVSIRPGASFVQVPTNSTVSAIFSLQRKLPGDDVWREVQQWSITASDLLVGGSIETITSEEVESGAYRLGCASGDYYAGAAFCRLATR